VRYADKGHYGHSDQTILGRPVKRPRGVLLQPLEGAPPTPSLRAGVYGRIRGAILAGRLGPGARLPSTRILSSELGISRTTAEEAYAQLVAEGYLLRRVGDGTYVSPRLPGRTRLPPPRPVRSAPSLSRRGRELSSAPACLDALVPQPFRAGHPDPALFPVDVWRRLTSRRLRHGGSALLGYGDAAGFRPLRQALADHLATSRGVVCEPEQIVILSSSQQALDLLARLLVDPGDAVWIEEPGYPGARAAFQLAGARLVPVPVDDRGLDVAQGRRRAAAARLAYVTPSHQYPLGHVLALERRLELLAWAREAGAWIVEDDYDAGLRYAGRPLAAVQGLDRDGRVVYVGTFTKLLFPSLRLAWAVLPEPVVEPFVHARRLQDGHPPGLSQAVATDFLAEGHLASWLRRLRDACAERRDALLAALSADLPEATPCAADAGLHLAVTLPGLDDAEVHRRALALGVDAPPLSSFRSTPGEPGGLVLGFAALEPAAIRRGVRALARAVAESARPRRG
jgi:GntR family transcriptional regulator / MocR family aminotransferase